MAGKPLIIEREINAPVSRVWKALTDQTDLKQWLPFFADFKPEVGYKLHFELGRDPEHQYVHLCKVKEVIKNKRLTYSWHYEGYPGYSNVTFELLPHGEKTRLKLIHEITEPFPADNPDFAESNFKEGWTYTADGLKKFVEESN
jgi:uncharacterized protein YndB with AHSA1/START domain